MPEPLTIYECPVHGDTTDIQDISSPTGRKTVCAVKSPPTMGPEGRVLAGMSCCSELTVHLYFREEDVRPLWDALKHLASGDAAVMWGAKNGVHARQPITDALDAFPAPESWRA